MVVEEVLFIINGERKYIARNFQDTFDLKQIISIFSFTIILEIDKLCRTYLVLI